MVKYTFDENPGKRFDAAMSNLWQSNPAYREQVAAERADERRKVIEELAREAERWEETDDVLICQWTPDVDAPYQPIEGDSSLSAWLRAHSKGGESATIGAEEEG